MVEISHTVLAAGNMKQGSGFLPLIDKSSLLVRMCTYRALESFEKSDARKDESPPLEEKSFKYPNTLLYVRLLFESNWTMLLLSESTGILASILSGNCSRADSSSTAVANSFPRFHSPVARFLCNVSKKFPYCRRERTCSKCRVCCLS
jgi:hypothetical protein